MSSERRKTYKIAGPATWELIRAAYLSGDSAPALAERFGVSEHAIRKRISVEKWSKRAYAEALEARGLEPPPRAKPLNVAERFAAHYAPPSPPSEPEHPFAELVSALKQATDAARAAPEADAAAAEAESPEELERRALAQAGAALAKGRAAEAKAFAALADQMRKRADLMRGAQRAGEEEVRLTQEKAEEAILDLFEKVSYLANAMVHAPIQAPAVFQGLIKGWREQNLGEGEADAERAAAKIAESQQAWLDGRHEANLPDYVREHMAAEWAARRAELEGKPVIPKIWPGVARRD
ncbi:MAG: hypothetical protein AB7P07_14015 [Hyphomonadaceae bacterium]